MVSVITDFINLSRTTYMWLFNGERLSREMQQFEGRNAVYCSM